MLFNTAEFFIFFIIVFGLYWFVFNKSVKIQNWLLLISSYFFYGCWDWRFMFLLAFTTLICYFIGAKIHSSKTERTRKVWMLTGLCINIGFLGFFKYCNFFIESFVDFSHLIGLNPNISTLKIILPVGISFYTFHGLSYIFDIHKRKIEPIKNLACYATSLSFFPILFSGPIERASHLLPQLQKPRVFDYSKAVDAMRQILWGLFKKIVIADTCGIYANDIFNNYEMYSGSTLIVGTLFYSFQIYGDFAGYSDIAIGVARLLGFDLFKNFNYPYFSRNIAEFWRRWHITLSSWFKDYLYFPLGGSRGSMFMQVRNTVIIFLVSGFWHGANWTFIFWGGLNALFVIPSIVRKTNRKYLEIAGKGKLLPSMKEFYLMTMTLLLASFTRIFFRSDSISSAYGYIKGICTASVFSLPEVYSFSTFVFISICMIVEWLGREQNFVIEGMKILPNNRILRWAFYFIILVMIFIHTGNEQSFIYFQF